MTTPTATPPLPRFQLRVIDHRRGVLACELLISDETVEKLRNYAATKGLSMEDIVGDAMEEMIEACEAGTVTTAETA